MGSSTNCLFDRVMSEAWPLNHVSWASDGSTASTASLSQPMSEEEEELQDIRVETMCYNALVKDGGRPSHPINLLQDILQTPGEYREILSYWQDCSNEWTVFSKQLRRWSDFRTYQRQRREQGQFPDYVNAVKDRLTRLDFVGCTFQLGEDPAQQNEFTTWIEYLNYEYLVSDQRAKYIKRHQGVYDGAWKKLVESNALRPSDTEESVSNIESEYQCERERREIVEAKETVRSSENEVRYAQNKNRHCRGRHSREAGRDLQTAQIKLEGATKFLDSINRRANLISEFKQRTNNYRSKRNKAERHNILLKWVIEQVDVIKREVTLLDQSDSRKTLQSSALPSTPSLLGRVDCVPSPRPVHRRLRHDVYQPPEEQRNTSKGDTFHCFMGLPTEVRFMIWELCLPPRPNVHFFDIINHPRTRHLMHSWSSKEFRICASKEHDSGYIPVYNMLKTCKDSRTFAKQHYWRLNQGTRHAATIKDQEQNQGSGGKHPEAKTIGPHNYPSFENFDWIPSNDIIVLCFPTKQAKLPKTHALTFTEGARHICVSIPNELIRCDETQMVSSFLRELCDGRKGLAVKKLYVDGGLKARSPRETNSTGHEGCDWIAPWSKSPVHWFADERRAWKQTFVPWKKVASAQMWLSNRDTSDHRRQFWWVGSGSAALAVSETEDIVTRSSMEVAAFASAVETKCRAYWGDRFEGEDILGWMV